MCFRVKVILAPGCVVNLVEVMSTTCKEVISVELADKPHRVNKEVHRDIYDLPGKVLGEEIA